MCAAVPHFSRGAAGRIDDLNTGVLIALRADAAHKWSSRLLIPVAVRGHIIDACTRKGGLMSAAQSPPVKTCDVCIVGAGIAGLNALFAASRYMSRDQKVILIDRRARVGGMWVDVYSYVRLHQPHPMFTAGNIEWTLGKDRSYLATKGEVLDHFQHCVDVIRERVQVDEYFGWDFVSEEESNGIVRVTCRSADGRALVVEAKRLIKAYGLAITPNEPLHISSKHVHS